MLQNSNATAAAAAAAAATPSTAAAAAAAAAANNAAIAASSIQPKLVVIRRRQNQGFGFTLRHFIAYPPEDDAASWPQVSVARQSSWAVMGRGGDSRGQGSGSGSGLGMGMVNSVSWEREPGVPESACIHLQLVINCALRLLLFAVWQCSLHFGSALLCAASQLRQSHLRSRRRYVSAKHAPPIQMAIAAFFLLFAKTVWSMPHASKSLQRQRQRQQAANF